MLRHVHKLSFRRISVVLLRPVCARMIRQRQIQQRWPEKQTRICKQTREKCL